VFNAEISSLLESLRMGAHGFSGNAGNYYPEVVQWLCRAAAADAADDAGDGDPERVQHLLTVADAVVSSPLYPASAKVFLAEQRGVPISAVCRVTNAAPGEHDRRLLAHLHHLVAGADLPVTLA
jgi:4-hydroxy-tetrahydrodipicolinate synthase